MQDSEIEKAIARFSSEMASIDELAHVLLKGHLLIEEALMLILEQHVFYGNYLQGARLSFNQKMLLARSYGLRKNNYGEWELIAAINALRNDLAHRLKSTDREKKLARLKEIYFREAKQMQGFDELEKASDSEIVFRACGHCSGFLTMFIDDARAFRKIVHELDRKMNPKEEPFVL